MGDDQILTIHDPGPSAFVFFGGGSKEIARLEPTEDGWRFSLADDVTVDEAAAQMLAILNRFLGRTTTPEN